ncbi:MAG: S41 family peptidase [Lachnospiraceae bacterium]|nr:S41 family peptidase [Lachnospiraceae bacterium]
MMKRCKRSARSVIIPAAAFCLAMPGAVALAGEYSTAQVTVTVFEGGNSHESACMFDSDLPEVPFVNVEDYLSSIYKTDLVCEKVSEGVYSYEKNGKKMTVDATNNTIRIETPESFYVEGLRYLISDSKYVKESIPKTDAADSVFSLDLSAYNIDIADDGTGAYIPLPTISDIFSKSYCISRYAGEEISIEHYTNLGLADMTKNFNALTRSQAMIDYTYNELCLIFDIFYGRPSKGALSESIVEKGFDKTLDDFNDDTRTAKELLRSENVMDFYYGLAYLDKYCWDGGHTMLTSSEDEMHGLYEESALLRAIEEFSEENPEAPRTEALNFIQQTVFGDQMRTETYRIARQQSYDKNLTLVKEWETAKLYQKDDTMIFVFDSFDVNVIEPFIHSLENAQANGVKNFIIDLSANEGGDSSLVSYIMAVISDDSRISMLNTCTGNIEYVTATADKNLDGVIDEKDDEIKYDLNYAILTSRVSFSCGNLLPSLAADRGIPVLGGKSGGGGCIVSIGYFPNGMLYRLSGGLKLVDKNGKDIENGAPLYYEVPGLDESISQLYDVDDIIAHVNEFYGESNDAGDAAPVILLVLVLASSAACAVVLKRKKA